MSRRTFVAGAGATAAAIGTAGVAGAQESDELTLDYGSDYVANPYVAATVNIAEHKADYSSALMYEDDDGNDTSSRR